MASDRGALPQHRDVEVQDFQLVQVLHEARRLADRHDGDGWERLSTTLDGILARMGGTGGEPAASPVMGIDRIDRSSFSLDDDLAQRVVASLRALGDRPDDRQLDLATRAVADLDEAIA